MDDEVGRGRLRFTETYTALAKNIYQIICHTWLRALQWFCGFYFNRICWLSKLVNWRCSLYDEKVATTQLCTRTWTWMCASHVHVRLFILVPDKHVSRRHTAVGN